jgi:type I restriction enzyme S subunit
LSAPRLPLRRLLEAVKTGTTPPSEQLTWLSDGAIPWYSPGDIEDSLRLAAPARTVKAEALSGGWLPRFPMGSTLLVGIGNVGKVAFLDHEASGNQQLTCLVPGPRIVPRFLAWQLFAMQDEVRATAPFTILPILNNEFVRSLSLTVPSRSKQQAIADYLDSETARIDALIEKKQRMVELLEEKWSVVVRETVLRDLDGSPLPLAPLKRRWRVLDCKHRTPTYVESGYPVVSPGDVMPGVLNLSRCNRFVDEADFRDLTEGRTPRKGDVIYSRNASVGIASFVADDQPFTMGQDVCLITSEEQDQRFLTYVLNTLGLDQLEEAKVGSTFSRINISQILALLVPVPPPALQSEIADAIDAQWAIFDRAQCVLRQQIDRLSEYRQGLITAAVTGSVEIAEVAA